MAKPVARDGRVADDREVLADVDRGRLVVERHDLRPARMSSRPWVFSARISRLNELLCRREDEAADAGRRRDPADAEVAQPLEADGRRIDQRRCSAAAPVVLKLKPGMAAFDVGGRWSLIARQHAAVEQHRALQAELDAELLVVVERHLGDQHLDHDLRRHRVELLDQAHQARRSTAAWR